MEAPRYEFFSELAAILNAGQSRSVLLCGNVHDLFFVEAAEKEGDEERGGYVRLIDFLSRRCQVKGLILIVYELNGPLRFVSPGGREALKKGWVAWRCGAPAEEVVLRTLGDRRRAREVASLEEDFEAHLTRAVGRPTVALELLRQLSLCSRARSPSGRQYVEEDLLVIIEAADLLLPAGDGDVSRLAPGDRQRIAIAQDWFSDPGFMAGGDSVVLVAESRSLIHPRLARLPQVLSVEVPAPDQAVREHCIDWFLEDSRRRGGAPVRIAGSPNELARLTAGLSVHALRQLLVRSAYSGAPLAPADVVAKVEEFIRNQLGEEVVEFKKPQHRLDDVVGFSRLKRFIRSELLPRFRASGATALPGAAVAGPIGGGKTFIFEAVAGALDLPVLVLKNIRSQWFGQTDVTFERLRRVLEALVKVMIFVDEADTQFGGVGPEVHPTERRLTGKIQQMMSDPRLRGRVVWLLMTARIHLLSPDIRRPGRVGDLIIPVLDPEGEDRREFLEWVLEAALPGPPREEAVEALDELTKGYSAAAFASLRSQLKAKASLEGPLTLEAVREIVHDHIPPAIELTRRYQALQALVNCTRRSLLPDPAVGDEEREQWQVEIRNLEALGVR